MKRIEKQGEGEFYCDWTVEKKDAGNSIPGEKEDAGADSEAHPPAGKVKHKERRHQSEIYRLTDEAYGDKKSRYEPDKDDD